MLRVLLLTALVCLVFSPAVSADGGFFPPRPTPTAKWELKEPEQWAILHHEDEIEHLFLQVKFAGNISDFGWIVPLPSHPEVTEASPDLFDTFHQFESRLHLLEWQTDRYYSKAGPLEGGVDEPPPAVTVLESKKVGVYDVTILSAKDAEALRKWLEQHEFAMPPKAEEILRPYVEREMFFAAIKVATAATGVRKDFLKPLCFKFKSAEPYFPLRVSRMNQSLTDLAIYYLHRDYCNDTRGTHLKNCECTCPLWNCGLPVSGDCRRTRQILEGAERASKDDDPANQLRELKEELKKAAADEKKIDRLMRQKIAGFKIRDHYLSKLTAEFLPCDMGTDLVLPTKVVTDRERSALQEQWEKGIDRAAAFLACADEDLEMAGAALRKGGHKHGNLFAGRRQRSDDPALAAPIRGIGRNLKRSWETGVPLMKDALRRIKAYDFKKAPKKEGEEIRQLFAREGRSMEGFRAALDAQIELLRGRASGEGLAWEKELEESGAFFVDTAHINDVLKTVKEAGGYKAAYVSYFFHNEKNDWMFKIVKRYETLAAPAGPSK